MKIKEGKRYVRRDGTLTGIIERNGNQLYQYFDSSNGTGYQKNGRCALKWPDLSDIVHEYAETETVQAESETLRDRFAMAALSGSASEWEPDKLEHCCKIAYRIADAMLEARKK